MNFQLKKPTLLVLASFLPLSLVGCSGGSGSDTNPSSQTIVGKAADGYLANARICLDINHNFQCDEGEPTTFTDSTGTYIFNNIPSTINLNSYRLVGEAIAGQTIDLDNPGAPIEKSFALASPRGQHGFISPLTTLLTAVLSESPEVTLEQAKLMINEKLGLSTNYDLTGDYLQNNSAEAQKAHQIARVSTRVLQLAITVSQESLTSLSMQILEELAISEAKGDFASNDTDVNQLAKQIAIVLGFVEQPEPIIDTIVPVIRLVGDATIQIDQGSAYTEVGATAIDNVDGDLTSQIQITGTVKTNRVGNYIITYSVTDSAGNTGTATRTVVVNDITAPVISLVGDATIQIDQGSVYTEAGAIATDNVDGDLTSQIQIAGTVNTNRVGNYIITYSVTDSAGNTGTATRTVMVLAANDVTAPVITLVGDATVQINQGATYNDAGATATDNVDGDLTNFIIVNGADFDTNIVGSYTITYDVSDTAGNVATQVVRTVNVVSILLGSLNDTGITWGGNYPEGNNTDCTGETIDQQDCSHGRDAVVGLSKIGEGHAGFDFTRLNADGSTYTGSGIYADAPWACVKDNHTGLVWEVKTPAGSGGIHDADNTYRWGGKTALLTGEFGERYDDWDTLLDGSNSASLCGSNDWRVPSRDELLSIVNYGRISPAIDQSVFPNTRTNWYWSASPNAVADYSNYAWMVDFISSYVDYTDRDADFSVRLVRSGQ